MANQNFVNYLSERDYDDLKYIWNEYASDKDGYANFASCWSINSSPIDLDVLADWLEDEDHEAYQEYLEEMED